MIIVDHSIGAFYYELAGFYFEDIVQIWNKEKFEDNKGVTRIRKSKKNRQYICQKKRDKRTNNEL
jgi:hypothetical protein